VYLKISDEEKHAKDILIEFESDYPGVTSVANVDDILKTLREKRAK